MFEKSIFRLNLLQTFDGNLRMLPYCVGHFTLNMTEHLRRKKQYTYEDFKKSSARDVYTSIFTFHIFFAWKAIAVITL